MKNKTIKARRMWANYHVEGYVCLYSTKGRCMNSAAEHVAIPVTVIPLHDVPALVATAACAHYDALRLAKGRVTNGDLMIAALTAIGVLPRQRKGGAK